MLRALSRRFSASIPNKECEQIDRGNRHESGKKCSSGLNEGSEANRDSCVIDYVISQEFWTGLMPPVGRHEACIPMNVHCRR